MNNITESAGRFRHTLTLRLLVRIAAAFLIYLLALTSLTVLAVLVFRERIWYGSELLYPLFHFLGDHLLGFFLFCLVLGGFGILLFYGGRCLTYLEQLLAATGEICSGSEQYVSLPPALQEAEIQLNRLRLESRQNARAAREAEQRKNDLVVYLAHDLKTPLTSVIGYLTLLKEEPEISPALREKYLSVSLDRAERLEDLINEFFEITRFSLTKLTLEPARIDLTRMLEQLIYEFNPMLEAHGLTCRLEAPPAFSFRCDPGKLQRVLDNLLRNAVHYSFEGTEILLTLTPLENGVRLCCTNRGNTIPPEKLERIFEQFFRLDAARTTRSGGAGLGLAIAKEIVELHGGSITAESRDEQITFTVFLPTLP